MGLYSVGQASLAEPDKVVISQSADCQCLISIVRPSIVAHWRSHMLSLARLSLVRLSLAATLLAASFPLLAAPNATFDFGHAAPAAQATRTVTVTLGDMYFEPKAVQVKAGETVHFVLINKGQLLHEFNLGDAAMHAAHQQEMLKMQQNGMLAPTAMKEMDHGSMSGMDHGSADHGMKHDD